MKPITILTILPPTFASIISSIFNHQPPSCEVCLEPIPNACEASIGPMGANPPAFAACICSRESLARVVTSCASAGKPCEGQTGNVSEAAMSWCFVHDDNFCRTICQHMEEGGAKEAYNFISDELRASKCNVGSKGMLKEEEQIISTPEGWESAMALVTAEPISTTPRDPTTVLVLVTDSAAEPTISEIVSDDHHTTDTVLSLDGYQTDSGSAKTISAATLLCLFMAPPLLLPVVL